MIFGMIFTINKLLNLELLNVVSYLHFKKTLWPLSGVCGDLCFKVTHTFLEIPQLLFWKGQKKYLQDIPILILLVYC